MGCTSDVRPLYDTSHVTAGRHELKLCKEPALAKRGSETNPNVQTPERARYPMMPSEILVIPESQYANSGRTCHKHCSQWMLLPIAALKGDLTVLGCSTVRCKRLLAQIACHVCAVKFPTRYGS